MSAGSIVPSAQPGFAWRSFTPEEVDALLRDVVDVYAEEQKRIPHTSVREMLGELGINPAGLDEAIARLDRRVITPSRRWRALPAWAWVAAAGLIAATSYCGMRIADCGMADRPNPQSTIRNPQSPIRNPHSAFRNRANPQSPIPNPRASTAQIRELRRQSVLLADADRFRLVVHNPFTRGVKRLLVRIDSAALGRRFDQRYWFVPGSPVESYESASMQVFHELPETPQIHSWKIEAADLRTGRERKVP